MYFIDRLYTCSISDILLSIAHHTSRYFVNNGRPIPSFNFGCLAQLRNIIALYVLIVCVIVNLDRCLAIQMLLCHVLGQKKSLCFALTKSKDHIQSFT